MSCQLRVDDELELEGAAVGVARAAGLWEGQTLAKLLKFGKDVYVSGGGGSLKDLRTGVGLTGELLTRKSGRVALRWQQRLIAMKLGVSWSGALQQQNR
ncbi:hypothetical protein WJX77_010681 [Trebouxia sp. C0004]